MTELKALNTGIAIVIGINKYTNGIPSLKNAVNDAKKVAKVLETKYQYQVLRLLDEDATLSRLQELLRAFKQQQIPLTNRTVKIAENDRIFFYFAGHGIAFDGLESAEGPQGFLVPQDGKLEEKEESLLPMTELHDALMALPNRHLLVTLDCCFAGSFRWAGLNRDIVPSQKLYRERYERFTNRKAAQVITSAAYDQKALDSVYRLGKRGEIDGHSPFAEALLKGLDGEREADINPDGAITATELYVDLQRELGKQKVKQTPGICQLKNHDDGEYIFPIPGFNPNDLDDAPELSYDKNPYRGLASFDEINKDLFFGRQKVIEDLYRGFNGKDKPKLMAVLGASGTGKSSLVKAGLLPPLREDGWYIVNPFRPGKSPFSALAEAILLTQKKEADSDGIKHLEEELGESPKKLTDLAGDKLLLVIDQFEELVTECPEAEKDKFLAWLEKILRDDSGKVRVIITLRSDFKAQFSGELFDEKEWGVLQFTVPIMTQDEYREVIEQPAAKKVLYFEPPGLVDDLINEVVQMPGALPLLSFSLSQLYFRCCDRWHLAGKSRAMTREDYQKLGGVMGALKRTATDVFNKLIKEQKATEQTIRDVMLRMVAVSGDELARRRVPKSELEYPKGKNKEVEEILKAFVKARLLVRGNASDGQPYVEPAHDALVNGWDKILAWKRDRQESLLLQRRLTPAAVEWKKKQEERFLWNADPYLDVLKKVLKSDDNWFNEVEEEFVGRSVRKRTRNGRLRWGIAVSVSVVLALAGVVADSQRREAVRQREEAVRQSEIALTRQLAAESESAVGSGFYQRGTLLAVESMKKSLKLNLPLVAVDGALRSKLNLLPYQTMQHRTGVNAVAFSADGKYLATASSDNTARVWDARTGEEIAIVNHNDWVKGVAFSADGKYIATASHDKTARVWDAATGEEITIVNHNDLVMAVAFSADGKYIATASFDKTARVWDATTGKELARLNHNDWVNAVAFSADGKKVATASDDKTARMWDATTGKELVRLDHNAWVNAVALSADGQKIATVSDDQTARMWDASTGKELTRLNHSSEKAVAFSADGKYVATPFSDTVRVWDANTGKEVNQFHHDKSEAVNPAVMAVAFSPDGNYVATGSYDGTVWMWNASTGNELARLNHDGSVNAVAFSADSKKVTTASGDQTVRVWDASTGQELARLNHDGSVNAVALSADGNKVATASNDRTVRVWDASTGKELARLNHDGEVTDVGFSADGRYVGTVTETETVRVWNASTGKESTKLPHHGLVNVVAFSVDGRYVATASIDRAVRVWDASTGKKVAQLQRDVWLNGVAFSVDNKYVATAADENIARVWALSTGKEIAQLNHDDRVWAVAFSPDGKYLATASEDNTARVHFLNSWDLINEACRRLGRNLTVEEWQRYMNLDLQQYHKTCDNLPVHPSVVAEGRDLASGGQVKEAIAIFRRALKLQPDIDLDPDTKEIDNDPEAVARELAAEQPQQ